MHDEPASSSSNSPDFSKVGFGAMGNVEVQHNASQHHTTTHQTTHTTASHHDDKSQHTDNSITKQTTIHHAGLSPMVLFALTCVIIAGFLFVILALKSETSSQRDGEKPTTSPPAIVIDNKPIVQVTMPGVSATVVQAPQSGVVNAPAITPASGLPQIELAQVGVVAAKQFIPRTSFKSGELLTLRLKVSRNCHVRVIYQPAIGDPVWMYPETTSASDIVVSGTELFIPDPDKLAAKAADATAFQLYHDIGSGPPIQEQIVIQIAEEPFMSDDTIRAANSPYRTYEGLTLADARMRGVLRLKGLDANAAQAQMESLLNERTLSFSITP